jgi:hypothetical protein
VNKAGLDRSGRLGGISVVPGVPGQPPAHLRATRTRDAIGQGMAANMARASIVARFVRP